MQNSNPAERPTRIRHHVLVMLFVTVVINYLDRSNLSVAATNMAGDLQIDTKHMGLLFSAFGWAYVAFQIPGGWLADIIRPRLLMALICALWSLATLLQGFAGTFVLLFSLRLLVGMFEAPSYPINNRLATTWFPDRERAGAIGSYTSGQFVGLAFLTPVLMLVQKNLGWHYLFILTGLTGIAWAAIWYWRYRDPAESPRMNDAELKYIQTGGGLADRSTATAAEKFCFADLLKVLSYRKLWGIYIGQIAVNSTIWFFLTWFPTYLVKYRHMDFIKAGFLASLPFLAAFCGILFSGFISDFMMRRGLSATTARKIPVITGLLLCTSIVGANYVANEHQSLIIMFLSIAGFGSGMSAIAWVFVSALAPKRLLGLTGGMFNFIGNLATIIVPLGIGLVVTGDDFTPGLFFVASLAMTGALCYIFVVGRVERVE